MTKKLTDAEKAQRALNKRRREADRSWEATFLAILATTASVKYACAQARITRDTAYKHKKLFPDFAAAWADAKADGIDDLVFTARTRALAGSDLLLMFLIKQADPSFRDNYQPPEDDDDQPLEITSPAIQQANKELTTWRDGVTKQLTEQLAAIAASMAPAPPSSLQNAAPTPRTSRTTTAK